MVLSKEVSCCVAFRCTEQSDKLLSLKPKDTLDINLERHKLE